MKISYRTFWIQKDGNDPKEYEDAFAPSDPFDLELEDIIAFAIADGVSNSFESKIWANILVKYFTEIKDINPLFFSKVTAEWYQWQGRYIEDRLRNNKPLKWYEEEGLKKGPSSTLLGLLLVKEDDGSKWKAVSIGDSCLFLVRDNRLEVEFPTSIFTEFNDFPSQVSLEGIKRNNLNVRTFEGELYSRDRIYLLTDAIAEWFLKEKNHIPWDKLSDIKNEDEFVKFIQDLREKEDIRNDDITCMCIRVY